MTDDRANQAYHRTATQHDVVRRLAEEIEYLQELAPAPEPGSSEPAAPLLTFGAGPFTAYAVVAALQLALRHPELSGLQRAVIDSFAHQVADALIAVARTELETHESAIETTLTAGFDRSQDRQSLGG